MWRKALAAFSRTSADADIALIYYAGHGIEVNGDNYLIPTDARLLKASDVEFEAITLKTAFTALNQAKKLKLVILDACRNNPFRAAMTSTSQTRSIAPARPVVQRINPECTGQVASPAALVHFINKLAQ